MNSLSCYDRLSADFEVEILERGLELYPENLDIVASLAAALTHAGDFARGLEMDQRLVAALPTDPVVRYNLACSLCLTGNLDRTLVELRQAIELGYREFDYMRSDQDLAALHGDEGFKAMLLEHENK